MMTALDIPTADEAQIRALIEDRTRALAVRDADALTARYADDVVLFDAVAPLRHHGAEAQAERLAAWLAAYPDGITYTIRDLSVTAGAEVAFCHYLYRVSGTMTNGATVDMWVRSTVGFRKIDGDWRIVHEHSSVPFDGATGVPSLDLQPD